VAIIKCENKLTGPLNPTIMYRKLSWALTKLCSEALCSDHDFTTALLIGFSSSRRKLLLLYLWSMPQPYPSPLNPFSGTKSKAFHHFHQGSLPWLMHNPKVGVLGLRGPGVSSSAPPPRFVMIFGGGIVCAFSEGRISLQTGQQCAIFIVTNML